MSITSFVQKLGKKFATAKAESTSQTNAKIQDKSSSSSKTGSVYLPYKGTVVIIRGDEEAGYYITLGDYRLCEAQPTIEDCENLLKRRDLTLLLTMMHAVTQQTIKMNEEIVNEELAKAYEGEKEAAG